MITRWWSIWGLTCSGGRKCGSHVVHTRRAWVSWVSCEKVNARRLASALVGNSMISLPRTYDSVAHIVIRVPS